MGAAFLDHRHNGFKVTIVIQGIKGSENIHAVVRRLFNKKFGHIIGIISVPHKVLAPQQH